MSANGVTGEWLPLGTLVRVPGFKDLRCPRATAKPCTLTGTNLFLSSSIAATPDINNSTDVPPDFTGTQLSVPHPVNGVLYLWLRDDPETVQTLTMPVTPANQPAQPVVLAPAVQTPLAPTQTGPGAAPTTSPTKTAPVSAPKPDAPANE